MNPEAIPCLHAQRSLNKPGLKECFYTTILNPDYDMIIAVFIANSSYFSVKTFLHTCRLKFGLSAACIQNYNMHGPGFIRTLIHY